MLGLLVQCARLHLRGPHLTTDRDNLRTRLEAAVRGAVRLNANMLTIQQLVEAFMLHGTADFAMRRGTTEIQNYRDAARELLTLYPDLPATDFDVLHLKAVRLLMIERGLCRETINRQRIRRVKTIFRWATEFHELDSRVIARLESVKPLRPGVDGVKEAPPKSAATLNQIVAVLLDPKCPTVNRAMLLLQRLTSARPGEVVGCVGRDIGTDQRDGHPWIWKPLLHKNLWRNKKRIIPIGPSAQLGILTYMNEGHLFLTKRGKPFRVDHYHQMIEESCHRQRIPRFSPQSVRRMALTEADELADIETAMELASHSDVRTTEGYLNRAGRRASSYAQKHG